jgi:hypothetical protein
MSGSAKDQAENVSKSSMIEQCKSVLNAGGTVYLGEHHEQADAREICAAALEAHCVQYLCLEIDYFDGMEAMSPTDLIQMIDATEKATLFKSKRKPNPISIVDLVKLALIDPGCQIVFIDKSQSKGRGYNWVDTDTNVRQKFMQTKVQECRAHVNKVGRGVLVLIGADHLVTNPDQKTIWQALHDIVYTGHSFVYGKCNNCYMVWQLS